MPVYRTGQSRQGVESAGVNTEKRCFRNAVSRRFSLAEPSPYALILFEAFERDAAGGGNAPAIGHQAMRNTHAIGNEFSAKYLSVRHASVLILLLIGPRHH